MRIKLLLLAISFLGIMVACQPTVLHAQTNSKVFTTEELSQFDGQNGHKAYYAYEGKVYDVTGSKLWQDGEHYGLHAGQDLTGKMDGAPHGTEVFAPFEVVGTYQSAVAKVTARVEPEVPEVVEVPTEAPVVIPTKAWYEGRIRILGISILGWTGILLAIFFVLTFGTCFAMPWAKLPLPWKGTRPGRDALDAAPRRMTWTSIHKYFVWFTVVLGIIHGILGLLQLVGIYL
jgi:predicted heme/steroid binding protein